MLLKLIYGLEKQNKIKMFGWHLMVFDEDFMAAPFCSGIAKNNRNEIIC